ncbi:hypothetical protein [Streptomyces sp. NPDC001741]|uniref:hypothetical protein n=1 Tax=Streptomyces sp. NPDC001741 TaxID=3364605 RepID=UPI00367EF20A
MTTARPLALVTGASSGIGLQLAEPGSGDPKLSAPPVVTGSGATGPGRTPRLP